MLPLPAAEVIGPSLSLQLEAVMPEIPAKFWLNLEADYQLTKALIMRRQQKR
jgi:plasmid maintenance system antidote protein VapI